MAAVLCKPAAGLGASVWSRFGWSASETWRIVAAKVRFGANDGRGRTYHEESDNTHEEEEERLAGRKRRRHSLSADRCENQGVE
jgi:hypothetical protein